MYLTRKHLFIVIAALFVIVVVLALPGCGTLNPACGGARGC